MFTRFFALIYDRVNRPAETAGLSLERQRLLAQASGETIEIGAGTGLNLAHYPDAVTRLVLFAEHVRSEDSAVAARQDRRPLPYKLMGCHPNRATLDTITSSPLRVADVRHGEVPKAPRTERPMIIGTARLSQTG